MGTVSPDFASIISLDSVFWGDCVSRTRNLDSEGLRVQGSDSSGSKSAWKDDKGVVTIIVVLISPLFVVVSPVSTIFRKRSAKTTTVRRWYWWRVWLPERHFCGDTCAPPFKQSARGVYTPFLTIYILVAQRHVCTLLEPKSLVFVFAPSLVLSETA